MTKRNLTSGRSIESRPLLRKEQAIVGASTIARDITIHKRAEEKLRQSEERYRSLFDSMLDGVYRSTHEGRFVDVNPTFVKMFGYSSKQEMLDITDIKKELYFSPEERGSHILDTGQEETEVYRMRRKDGSEIWVEDHGRYVHDEQGNIIYHEGILRDVTERKRLEEELKQHSLHLEELVDERTRRLRESEEQLRAILNATTASVMVLDREGKIIEANIAFCKSWDLSHDEVVGRNAFSLLKDPEVMERRKTWIDEVFRTGQYLRKEDEHKGRWSDSIMYPVQGSDGTVVAVTIYAMNVTEHKRMEEELRAAKKRLEYVVTSNPAAIYAAKPLPDYSDFVLTYLSESIVSLLGFEPQQFVGHPEFWEQHVHPDNQHSVLEQIPILWKKGKHTFEYQFMHKDGTYRWIREEAKVIRDADRKPIEVNGYWIDITERKRLEERLAESERLAAIGETAAMVGHDLRNPLQGIAGALHLLKQQSLTAEERNEMLQVIEKSLEYSDAIIRDLLDYSAEIQLKLAGATPKSITSEALGAVKVPQNVKTQNLSEDQPTLRVDPDRIRRVFINLIENAIDAMPQGGTLTISSKKSDGNVEIALTDSGLGMPEKVMENLWKPLQTTKAKGLGLGLAICKRVVDAHGGRMSVKSEGGVGTTFTMQLPIRPVEVKQK